jgi:hypothetical protein
LPRFPTPNGNVPAFPQTDFHLWRNGNLHFTLYLKGHGDSHTRKIGKPPTKQQFTLYSLVECLTQRRREAESAEKSQKSEGKERYDKKRPGNFFHPIGENNYDTN